MPGTHRGPVPGWRIEETQGGIPYLRCDPLLAAGLDHAFTLRPPRPAEPGGPRIPPGEVMGAIGLAGLPVSFPTQVHGRSVARPCGPSGRTDPAEADAVIVAGAPGCAAVATADCVGAILLAPGARAFAVVHAGWRGTLAGVMRAAVLELAVASGAPPASMVLAMGPAIGPCCYEVGEEVAGAFRDAFSGSDGPGLFGRKDGRTTLDIVAANRRRAVEVGIAPERIHAAGICTFCRKDLCWSYRAEGRIAGRMWAVAGLPDRGASATSRP